MAESLDLDAMIARFRERAAAVKRRTLPPVGGAERQQFIEQAQTDYRDSAMSGAAGAGGGDGVVVSRTAPPPPASGAGRRPPREPRRSGFAILDSSRGRGSAGRASPCQ